MSKFQPLTSEQLHLDGFAGWDKKVRQDVEDFQTDLLQRLALEQLPDPVCIQQTISGVDQQERKKDEGYYRMDPEKVRAVLPKKLLTPQLETRSPHCLFAKMSESEIAKLCAQKFFYSHDGDDIPIHFVRDPSFLLCERLFSTIATKNFLPLLSFPFLPYSRKFVNLIVDGKQKLPKNLDPAQITDRNPEIRAKIKKEIVPRLKANLLPLWNIYTHEPLIVNPQNDGVYYRYKILDRIDEESDLILHHVMKNGKDLEEAKVEKVEGKDRHQGQTFVKSRSHFEKLVYSEISFRKETPQWRFEETRKDHFWYRQFLQSFQLTASDVQMLLALVFADEGTRDRFVCWEIEKPQRCPDELYETLQSEAALFMHHLWYLREDPFKIPSREELRMVKIRLRYKLDGWDERRSDDTYLDQDRVNYFAALCSLYMPHGYFCVGELLDA